MTPTHSGSMIFDEALPTPFQLSLRDQTTRRVTVYKNSWSKQTRMSRIVSALAIKTCNGKLWTVIVLNWSVNGRIYKNVFGELFTLHWLQQMIASDTLRSQTSRSRVERVERELKELTQETIVQVARSLGTKSLDTNRIFSLRHLSVAFTNNSPEAT